MNLVFLTGHFCTCQLETITSEDDDGDDDDDEVIPIMPEDKYRVSSLEKMITVIALLVEKSRVER